MKQVTNPPEDFIIQRLQEIQTVSEIQAATEEDDPNGSLNKSGGYTAADFFSGSLINQDEVYGNNILEKGTSCGGSIEVFTTIEDAQKRNTYLSTYDGATAINPGSHSIIGTVVVRTSNNLTATQQKELEQQIFEKLLELK